MKKITLLISGLFVISSLFAQKAKEDDKVVVIPCTEFHVTRPLSELVKENPVDESKLNAKTESEDRENRKPQKFPKSVKDGPEYGNDPSTLQKEEGTVPGKAPIMNIAGQTATSFRPFDPSGAAGLTHYVQMINSTTFRVYNKSTGATMLTATLGNLWSPATVNDGDPIVMYDKAADRWFLAQFGQTGNKIYIAISTTGDPTGSYYTYTFSSPDFPDYLKFSVWQDGYYMTGNYAQKVFCFERSAMLTGSAGARSIYKTFSPPNAGYFFVPLTGDAADGVLPAAGTPCPIFSYSDNGWGGTYTDAINIFKMAVTWAATPTATITSAGTIPTAAFDATYDASWNDVSQPGTTQKLDGIGGVLMYRAQWKTWSGYNTVVLNWAVKISATQRSLKWCELRQNQSTGVWSMYQEGIYTPDANTRWLGSIAMDNNGSIGLAYMKANSSSIYPGLYYTGRRTCDALGTLPVTETVAIAGTGSQTGINRDGDYAQMTLDPDGITFWYTGEYMGGATGGSAAKTRIFSFQIAPCSSPPVANFSATPTTICAGQTVAFTDLSTNTPTSWAWTFTGGTPSSSTVQNPSVVYNTPGTYSVTLTATNASGSNTVTQTNYITVNAVPATPTATATSPVCTGSTITLTTPTVTGATYAWTGPSGYTSAVQNPTRPGATAAMAGTYSVVVTTSGCSSAPGTATVVVNSTPVVTVNSPTVCSGQPAVLTASGGTTYLWNTGSSSNPLTVTPVSTTTYTVTGTTSGCSGTAIATVTVNPVPATPTATATSPVCTGSTITLTTPTVTGATYAWSGPSAYTSAVQNPTRPGATAAMAGTYSVTVTTGGCTSAAGTATVVVNTVPSAPTATSNTPVCAGSTINLMATTVTGATYSWTGPSSFTNTAQNPTRPVATAAMAGTYSVTATVSGCTSIAGTTTVVVNTAPVATFSYTGTPYCKTAANPSPTFSGGGIAGTFSSTAGLVFVSTSTGQVDLASSTAGTYTVTNTIAASGGCPAVTATSTITITAQPAATFSYTGTPYCKTAANPSPTFSGGGVAGTFTSTAGLVFVSSSTGQVNLASSTAGTYTVTNTVAASGGCAAATATSTITINNAPIATFSYTGSPYCKNAANPSPTYSGGGVAGTFSSTAGLVFVSTATGQVNLSSSTAGTYTVTNTIAASGGCAAVTATSTIVINANPVANAGPDISYCSGLTGTIGAPAVGGYTYSWSPATNLSSSAASNPTVSATATTTYIVTATFNGCTSTDAVIVTVNPAPITTVNSPTICQGQSATLTASGATSYAWTAGLSSTTGASVTGSPSSTTSYTVTGTSSGCSSSAIATITVNPSPAVTVNSPTICAGQTANLTANGATTYTWSSGATSSGVNTATASPAATTSYTVTGTTSGCVGTSVSTVTVNPLPTVTVPPISICAGSSGSLTASGASTYSWAPATGLSGTMGPTVTASPAATTTYTVTGTSSAGCVKTTTVVVTVNPQPISTFTQSPNQCLSGNSFSFTNTGSSGAGYTYSWTFAGGTPGTSTINSPTGVTFATSGTHSITHVINGTGGCTSTNTSTVTIYPGPTAQAATTTSTGCGSATGSITLGATTGGTSPYTFSVNGSGFTTTTSYTGLSAGTYSVIVKDANGCTFTTSATISNSSGPTAQSTSTVNSTCGNANGTITIGSTTGGLSPYTYSVNGGAYTSSTTYSGLTAGTYPVNVKDANGCIFSTNVVVSNTAGPTAQSTTTVNSTCGNANGAINIGSTTGGTASYTYSFNGGAFGSITSYTGLTAGTYTVIVKDANGCTFTVNPVVSNTSGPTAAMVTSGNSTCGGSDGTINIGAVTGGTSPYTYSVNGSAFTTNTIYTGFAAGTYPIVVTDANGCTFTTSATVGNTGSTPTTPTITQSGSVLTSSSATGNQWYLDGTAIPGATNQNYTFTANGSYTVVVTTGGCSSASSTATVITGVGIAELATNPYSLSVYPNPNDGNFTISFSSTDKASYKVEIVNALGQLVFRDDVKDFTGTYKKEMSVVEYGQGVYTISLTNSKNETVKKIIVY